MCLFLIRFTVQGRGGAKKVETARRRELRGTKNEQINSGKEVSWKM
jgi:hypothetical protein